MSDSAITYRHEMQRAARLVESDYLPQYAARSYAISAKGTQEQINQDSYLVADHFPATGRHLPGSRKHMPSIHDPGDALFIVADGAGEPQAGCRASSLAVEQIEESLRQTWASLECAGSLAKDRQVLSSLRVAFDRADQVVWSEAGASQRAGAAVTAVASHGGKLYLAQVGDNPVYLWRAGKLHRLTTPQDSIPSSAQAAHTSNEGSGDHEKSMVGGRRAGTHIKLRVVEIESNDYLLLCTKGLVKHVRDHFIRSTISATPDPQRICDSLFAEAGKYPIPEDLTMIVARFALTHG
jgi:serine/threonine protein phosphatase PrpC